MLLLIVGVNHVVGFHHVQTIEVLTLLLVFIMLLLLLLKLIVLLLVFVAADHVATGVHRVVSVQLFSQVPSLLFNMFFFPFGFSISPILALSCTLEFHWRQKVNGWKVSTKNLAF